MRTLLALFVAVPLWATTVTVVRDGAPVKAEVCRFRADDSENPFRRWLASQEVVCAAESSVEFPRGLWNVFARTSDALSAPVLVDGGAAPEQLTLSLRTAMAITPMLPPASTAIVYAPRLGVAWPVPTLVPAGEPLWLFVLEKSRVAAVVPTVEPRVDARAGGPSAVIGWLQMPAEDRAMVQRVSGLMTPAIVLRDAVADTLPPLELLHGAFFRIPSPEEGAGEVRVQGRGWVPDRARVKVDSALTLVPDPLTVRASGTLAVNWNTYEDLVALDRSLGSCKEGEANLAVEIIVSACAAPRTARDDPDPASCSVIRTEVFAPEEKLGGFTLDDLVPGTYRAEFRFGRLPPLGTWRRVGPLQVARLNLFVEYEEVYGSLTKGGEPLGEDATITFPTGVAFAAEKSEEYRGVVRTEPIGKDAQVVVVACDGSPRVTVLTDHAIRRGGRFNIDIPANELAISVVDTFTREPLGGAQVKMDVFSIDRPPRVVMTRTFVTGEQGGRVTVESVPEREIRLTVSHGGYQRQTVPGFSLTRTERKELEVQLVPLRGSRARIVSAKPFEGAMAYWFAPSGRQTEQAEIGPDGTFVYSGVHGPEETLTIVSSSHPLWVTASPRTNHRDSVTLPFPDNAAFRTFDVLTAGTDPAITRFIGVAVGGLRVPLPALRNHQQLRRLASTIRGRGPAKIADILETGPIDVLLGPTTAEVAGPVATMDLFALEQFANPLRSRLAPGAATVVFDEK